MTPNQADDKHQNDRTQKGDQDTGWIDAIHYIGQVEEYSTQPTSNQPASDTHEDVTQQAKPVTPHHQPAYPTSNRSHYDPG
jgi:hypothetical protein